MTVGESIAPAAPEAARRMDWLVATVVGATAATWVAAALSVLAGRLRPAVGVASLLAGLLLGALAGRVGKLVVATRERLSFAGVLALLAFAVASLRQFGWLVFEKDGQLLTLLPYNYGDLPLHWTYVRNVAGGASFWPQDPILVGVRLHYPLGVDLLSAVFVQLGAPLPALLVAMGLAGAALTALALRSWGGALAVAGFLFAGGLAGFQVLWTGRLLDYQAALAWKDPFLALFVTQRGFLLAMPAALLLLWSWRRRLIRGEPALASWVEGILWGGLPLLHLHTFAFVSLIGVFWAIGGSRPRSLLASFGWAFVPAAWAAWEVTEGFRAASLVGLQPGWMIHEANPVVFLLVNFGLFLPLALVALALAVRRRCREELLLLGPALFVFAALFFVRVAPWEWDNTKVMIWCYLLSLPAIEGLVLKPVRPPVRTALVVGLLFSGAVSVAAASLGGGPRLEILDRAEYAGVCQALARVGRDERVATAQTHNHPVALCGQPIVAGYAGHLWSHGLDARRVERDLARLLAGDPDYRLLARRLGARYLFWGQREREASPLSKQPWKAAGPPVAAGAWGALYSLQ